MPRTLIVNTLHISDRVAAKLEEKHGLRADEVRDRIEGVGLLPFRWDDDPQRGPRALVWTSLGADAVLVVPYPSRSGDPEEWHLGSAYTYGLDVTG